MYLKAIALYFKHYKLLVYVVRFCEILYACSSSSIRQDPVVGNAKKKELRIIFAKCIRNSNYVFFLEYSQRILKTKITRILSSLYNRHANVNLFIRLEYKNTM